MAKPYHPCYTNANPAAEARRYTSEKVYFRKVTLIYDWLPPDREVESWFRRVPYRLEKGDLDGSWVVKYFEFRAGIGPLPELGFVGDLWISWNAGDPSVWFKVEETEWERWGGCASSVREKMNAKHPFLDKAYLWFSPRDFFFTGRIPNTKLSLKWEQSPRIRRVAPTTRIIDPDSCVPPKKVPVDPVYLPSMRTIVRTLCPNMPQLPRSAPLPAPTIPVADRGEDCDGETVVASTSKVQIEDLQGPFPVEETVLGDDVEIDWDWWGSTDGEAEDEATEVGGSQPQLLSFTPTPPPMPPSRNLRYSPYRFTPPPATPFKKFKPPARYAKGTLDPKTSPSDPRNTPASVSVSTSSTVVDPTTPTPRLTSEPISFVFTDDSEKVADPRGQRILSQGELAHPHKPSQRTLEEVARILREDGHNRPGVWALLPPELYDAGGDLAAELPVPILDLGHQTLHKIRRLLLQDGFAHHGILILKMHNPSDDEQRDIYDQMVKKDILAWI